MLKVVGVSLALVGALALVGCGGGGNGGKSDKGVVLPDGGPKPEQGIFPDHGPYPEGGGPTEGGAGDTCAQIMQCAASCTDQACMNACAAKGTPDAQSKFAAVVNCMNAAGTGTCKTQCTDPKSTACGQCIAQACDAEMKACTGGGTATGSNSGAICNQSKPCPDASEGCFQLNPSSQNGMCLGKCNTGDTCKVPDPTTQLSQCNIQETTTKEMYCAWFCEVTGKTYKCPNDTDYACQAINAQQPDVKYCVPK